MSLSYDSAKNQSNLAKHGLCLDLAAELDWSSAWVVEDLRGPYPERRFQALGLIRGRLHMLVFTPRPSGIHVVSLRRANRRERARHAATQAPSRYT